MLRISYDNDYYRWCILHNSLQLSTWPHITCDFAMRPPMLIYRHALKRRSMPSPRSTQFLPPDILGLLVCTPKGPNQISGGNPISFKPASLGNIQWIQPPTRSNVASISFHFNWPRWHHGFEDFEGPSLVVPAPEAFPPELGCSGPAHRSSLPASWGTGWQNPPVSLIDRWFPSAKMVIFHGKVLV